MAFEKCQISAVARALFNLQEWKVVISIPVFM